MVPTSLTTSPIANGVCHCLNAGRTVSTYYSRDSINEWCEQTHDQHSISVFLTDAVWLLKWQPADGDPQERQIRGPAAWLVPAGIPHALICSADANGVTLLMEGDLGARHAAPRGESRCRPRRGPDPRKYSDSIGRRAYQRCDPENGDSFRPRQRHRRNPVI